MKSKLSLIALTAVVSAGTFAQESAGQSDQLPSSPTRQEDRHDLLGMDEERLDDMKVTNAAGEDLGEIDEIVKNRETQEYYALVEIEGALGFGEREFVIPLEKLTYVASEDHALADLSLEELESQQEFDDIKDRYQEIEEAE